MPRRSRTAKATTIATAQSTITQRSPAAPPVALYQPSREKMPRTVLTLSFVYPSESVSDCVVAKGRATTPTARRRAGTRGRRSERARDVALHVRWSVRRVRAGSAAPPTLEQLEGDQAEHRGETEAHDHEARRHERREVQRQSQ